MEKPKPARAANPPHEKGPGASPGQTVAVLEFLHLLAGILIDQHLKEHVGKSPEIEYTVQCKTE
ncbi:hypothetical protein LAG90_09315 [Marinilongibacter aquaticus]|uniref:hypothetical protein n=1 Tax=Marinilongibacter aquaticus TaxID=2975157 RepID=UPI0021BDB5E4|nr:hypothetical protein [Marinilongibacter aquaticus]UBM60065.1 hypothetical protein LAG90_05330 [Marinilongibacter aquaticus]UBM60834.1 hypothetical protein LAG90_09315 [Marinilongibacter aquaticus]